MIEIARAVEIFVAINLIAVGLSHIFQPRAWREFFTLLESKGNAGNFLNAFLALSIGAVIVAGHNIWLGVPTIITIYGWLCVLKGTLYLVHPKLGMKGLRKGMKIDRQQWALAGIALVLLGTVALLFGVETPDPNLQFASGG